MGRSGGSTVSSTSLAEGSVGAEGSVFWLKLPIREPPVEMHSVILTFVGKGAEKSFRDYLMPSIPVVGT